jgi:raffinose/stachyose/melibiose transport system substrate-binding protein
MAIGGNIVGLYYNDDLLSKIGATAPKTFDDVVADMQKAKDAGILPLEVGNLDQIQAGHIASSLMTHFQSPTVLNNWINGTPGSDIQTSGTLKALATLQDWVDRGYISGQADGLKEDAGAANFASGGALFDITGSWRSTQFDAGLGDHGGFMTLPGSSASSRPATGWFSEGWTISSKTPHANIAAYFLNYMSGPGCVTNNIIGGYLPFSTGATTPGKAVTTDVMSAWYKSLDTNGLSGYLDSATPSMGTTEFPALQSLLAGKETPSQVLQAMQSNWTSHHKR